MSLDDFFKKKQKKKPKGQKWLSTEEMAKRLEEAERKEEEKAANEPVPLKKIAETHGENGDMIENKGEDTNNQELWNDFEEKVQVDVSDLKLSNLNTEEVEKDGEDGNDENDSNNGDNKKGSVWKTEPQEAPSICDAMDEALEDGKDAKAIDAHAWKFANSQTTQASPLPRGPGFGGRNKKKAPDLKNEDAFPTLGNKPKRKQNTKKSDESASSNASSARGLAKHGKTSDGRPVYVPPSQRANVKCDNRYGSLTDQGSRWC